MEEYEEAMRFADNVLDRLTRETDNLRTNANSKVTQRFLEGLQGALQAYVQKRKRLYARLHGYNRAMGVS